ncbi:MAG: GNAT family N-acetyltransferase [Actinomycetota bacterium]|nr:GNAT family N-acetyltransferase [Actinomycetota bacterium]
MRDIEQGGNPAAGEVRRVRIVQLSADALHALARGDLTAANAAAAVPMSGYFAGPEWRGVWRRRSTQVLANPLSAEWITGVIWDPQRVLAVGRAGYHGPPDAAGMVEIGYAVEPAHRRQGYARAALVELLQRAARERDVGTVRATVSPDNIASRRLILQYGFTEIGEQWDDEDGLEIIYEVAADRDR